MTQPSRELLWTVSPLGVFLLQTLFHVIVDLQWLSSVQKHPEAPLRHQNNPQAPSGSPVPTTYGAQSQRSGWRRGCETASHTSQDQLLSLLLLLLRYQKQESICKEIQSNSQQPAASSKVGRSHRLPQASNPSLMPTPPNPPQTSEL